MDHIYRYLLDPCLKPPEELQRFLNGDCHLFAIAVHRLTGWEIIAITEPRYVIPEGISPNAAYLESLKLPKNEKLPYGIRPGLVHAACYHHDDTENLFDAKGWRKSSKIADEYQLHRDCSVAHYSQEKLYNIVHYNEPINEVELAKVIVFVQKYYSSFF